MKPEYINPNNIAILLAVAGLIFCKEPIYKMLWGVIVAAVLTPLISSGIINRVEWHLILTEPQLQGKLLFGIVVVVFIVASIQMWKKNGMGINQNLDNGMTSGFSPKSSIIQNNPDKKITS